jgi:large subunit ribosomal protein L17
MLRNLTANLITHERIQTTDAKAKELRRVAERLITKATRLGKVAYTPQAELSAADKAKRIHAEHLVASYVPRFGVKSDGSKIDIVEKVLIDLSKRFEGRPGGYTRITKIGNRRGDNAPMVLIEFIDAPPIVDAQAPEAAGTVTAAEPTSAATASEASASTASASESAPKESSGETASDQ